MKSTSAARRAEIASLKTKIAALTTRLDRLCRLEGHAEGGRTKARSFDHASRNTEIARLHGEANGDPRRLKALAETYGLTDRRIRQIAKKIKDAASARDGAEASQSAIQDQEAPAPAPAPGLNIDALETVARELRALADACTGAIKLDERQRPGLRDWCKRAKRQSIQWAQILDQVCEQADAFLGQVD